MLAAPAGDCRASAAPGPITGSLTFPLLPYITCTDAAVLGWKCCMPGPFILLPVWKYYVSASPL